MILKNREESRAKMSIVYQEIRDQYRALSRTMEEVQRQAADIRAFIRARPVRSIVFMGCGSSYYICCSLRSIAAKRIQLPVHAVAAGDLWLNADSYAKVFEDALVVSLSRSGKTSEVLLAVEAIRQRSPGARFLSILCERDSPLQSASDQSLCLPWAFDVSVCQTRCVSNMYAAGAIGIALMTGDDATRSGFRRAAEIGGAYLDAIEPRARALAKKPWNRVVTLSDGDIDGLAEEGALAFKEISEIPSNYYHLLDVRHGPMVLIGPGTLVLAAAKAPLRDAERALFQDIQKRGATLAVYSTAPLDEPNLDAYAFGDAVGDAAGGLGFITLCQLVSYYKSFQVGCDPDHPDGLKAWIEIG